MAVLILSCVAGLGSACKSQPARPDDSTVLALTTSTLQKFHDMADFESYRGRVRELAKSRGVRGTWVQPVSPADALLAENVEPPCDPAVDDCGKKEPLQQIVMTASKAAASQSSITNNQERSVDEGDIVKHYGRFLIVLQDGRLYSIDTGSQRGELRLVDRINLYESPDADVWYDEMLIHGNRLVVTGFNYGDGFTEISVLSIDPGGKLALTARFDIESDDYYSESNYASRLVRGRLVLYTPLYFHGSEPLQIPGVRRWLPETGYSDWTPLLDITDVYKPIQDTLFPVIHVVSLCSLAASGGMNCDSRGVVGPDNAELYVSARNAYLWVASDYLDWVTGRRWPSECEASVDPDRHEPRQAAAFQMPIDNEDVRAVQTIGIPQDQFAFAEQDGQLLALLVREPADCYLNDSSPMILAKIPLKDFSRTPGRLDGSSMFGLPPLSQQGHTNRFTRKYVAYAGTQGYWSSTDLREAAELVVVPIADPARARLLHPPHSIERLEVIGRNLVGFGVSGTSDLGVSTLELRSTQPRIASTRVLTDLRETEGRSHAFNSVVSEEGSGSFGLPTVYRSKFATRFELPSDVQFFTMDPSLAITPLGELSGVDYAELGEYECVVSCDDWYGNARPIFIDDRIFALTGAELIEGEIHDGVIVETARLRMTTEPVRPN